MSRPARITVWGLLAALATGATWIGHEYSHDIGEARARIATGSRVVATRCGPIEYAEVGRGPVVLGIHGAGGGFDQVLALGAPLAAKGFRLVAMSRFGYLRTPVPAHPTIALQADAHACLLDALGIDSAAVIGVSAGAPSALEFALRHRERCRALVLLVPGWYPGAAGMRRMGPIGTWLFEHALRSDFLFWAVDRFLPGIAARAVLGTPPEVVEAAPASEQQRVAGISRRILPVSQRQAGLVLDEQFVAARLSGPLESITAPALAISVEDDLYGTYANARFIAARIPHCQLVGYRSGGHLWVGHNAELLATVLAFLSAQERSSQPPPKAL